MRKILIVAFFIIGMMSLSHAEQVPKSLYEAMNDYMENKKSDLKQALRGTRADPSIRVSELEFETPIRTYAIKNCNQNSTTGCPKYIDTDAPVMSFIRPAYWRFYIKARGIYVFGVEFVKKKGGWERVGLGGMRQVVWSDVMAAYPESKGIHPIIVMYGGEEFLHFPQINTHNLTMFGGIKQLKCRFKVQKNAKEQNDTLLFNDNQYQEYSHHLTIISPDSYHTLTDSRKTLHFLKIRGKWRKDLYKNFKRGGK